MSSKIAGLKNVCPIVLTRIPLNFDNPTSETRLICETRLNSLTLRRQTRGDTATKCPGSTEFDLLQSFESHTCIHHSTFLP